LASSGNLDPFQGRLVPERKITLKAIN